MGEIVGRFTCPVCGEPAQDLKVNKNRKLYCYCDNGCKSQLNSKNSRAALAALKSGKTIRIEKIGIITPVNMPESVPAASRDELAEDLDI